MGRIAALYIFIVRPAVICLSQRTPASSLHFIQAALTLWKAAEIVDVSQEITDPLSLSNSLTLSLFLYFSLSPSLTLKKYLYLRKDVFRFISFFQYFTLSFPFSLSYSHLLSMPILLFHFPENIKRN